MNDSNKKNVNVVIDKRPITQVFFNRIARFIVLMGLFVSLYLFLQSDPWQGLSVSGYRAIGAFFLCVILWFTQLIPLAITGLLALVIIPLLEILPASQVFGYFGNESVFFILGAFILAAAIMRSGLSTRLSILLLKRTHSSPKKLIFGILFSCALLSCMMSEHAVAAFFFPIILEIARALDYEPFGGEYGKTLFLAMAWGCIIGGVVTFLGGARTPLAIGILFEMTGKSVGFFEWMKTSVFVALPLITVAYFLLTRYFKIDVTSVDSARAVLEQKAKEIGRISLREVFVSLILFSSILGWMFLGKQFGLANIAILAVVALFVFGTVNWRDVENYVNWGIILMYGGAIALGRAVSSSGALEWLSGKVIFFPQYLSDHIGLNPSFWLIALLSFFAILLSELVSNAAVVALLLPVAISIGQKFQLPPEIMVYVISLPCGLAFMLPMATPANALAYSSGYLKMGEMAKAGLILTIAAWLLFLLVVKFIWPLYSIVF